jgi:hypothetical protein
MHGPPETRNPAAANGRAYRKDFISSTDLTKTSLRIQAFMARCDARALLWWSWMMDLQDAVDALQVAAERTGLVADLGQDKIQKIMSNAFAARRNIQC